jgi:hypothetical protein
VAGRSYKLGRTVGCPAAALPAAAASLLLLLPSASNFQDDPHQDVNSPLPPFLELFRAQKAVPIKTESVRSGHQKVLADNGRNKLRHSPGQLGLSLPRQMNTTTTRFAAA